MSKFLDELQQALRNVKRNVLFSDTDWSLGESEAWIYGILVGWSDEILDDLAVRLNWNDVSLNALRALRRAVRLVQDTDLKTLGKHLPELKSEPLDPPADPMPPLKSTLGSRVDLVVELIDALYGPESIEGQTATLRDAVADVALLERRQILQLLERQKRRLLIEAPDDGGEQAVATLNAVAELAVLESHIRERKRP